MKGLLKCIYISVLKKLSLISFVVLHCFFIYNLARFLYWLCEPQKMGYGNDKYMRKYKGLVKSETDAELS